MPALTWIGGPTVLLDLGGLRILTDPMFGEGPAAFVMRGHPSTGAERADVARAGPLPPVDVHAIDAIVVSHLHTDHFDDVASERLPKHLPVFAPHPNVEAIAARGFGDVTGIGWGESHAWPDEGVEIVAVPARHSADDAVNADLGVVNGYVLTYPRPDGRGALYWTGDTVWFDGLAEVRRHAGDVELLLAHLGAVGTGGPWGRMTMNAAEGARLVELFRPDVVVPIHHHTFDHYVEPVAAFERALAERDVPTRLVVLEEGGSLRW